MKVKMNKDRDTKGTYVYKNNDEGSPITSLYIKKSGVSGDAPDSITVEIKEIK